MCDICTVCLSTMREPTETNLQRCTRKMIMLLNKELMLRLAHAHLIIVEEAVGIVNEEDRGEAMALLDQSLGNK